MHLTNQQKNQYKESGYLVVPALFDQATAAQMAEHYITRRSEGPKPGDFGGTADQPDDPTHNYPRMINMHNWDPSTKEWATQESLLGIIEQLIDDQPVLQQTMIYFKPPGGRGQGLHQDQQYITIDPLIGVWVALDTSDRAVGQMIVVPSSHKQGLYEVEAADTSLSFTDVQTVIPDGAKEVGVDMNPGDVLFFHGKTIHGSYPNTTTNRWRRSFICHYIGKHAQKFEPDRGQHVSHVKR